MSRNLPRTFVVLLAPIDVTVVQSFTDKPVLCQLTHKYECPCLFQQNNGMRGTKRVKWLHSQYKKILKRLSYEEKYNRDDFTVEYITAMTDDIPRYILLMTHHSSLIAHHHDHQDHRLLWPSNPRHLSPGPGLLPLPQGAPQ